MTGTLYDIPLKRIDGSPATLGDYRGQVMMVVNVASKCGLTPQYEGLEKLHEAYHHKGFTVLGFPANEFAGQEPGSNAEIAEFCQSKFGVQFPMYEKIVVKGDGQHPLYRELVAQQPAATQKPGGDLMAKLAKHGMAPKSPSEVAWNFEKFLIGRDGKVKARFAPDVTPGDPMVKAAIEKEI